MSIRQGKTIIAGQTRPVGGMEIGDIGQSALGINESENLRRYLNGQVIQQNQFRAFTIKLNEKKALTPGLFCTNEEFEAELALSAKGQCGKFVIDDAAGTIRLPKVINTQGLVDLQNAGMRVEAGLPNITGSFRNYMLQYHINSAEADGAFFDKIDTNNGLFQLTNSADQTEANKMDGVFFDASKSNPVYGKSTTVQEEAIQYPYFIQVATGFSEKNSIVNEYHLNNPYSLLDSKWSDHKLENISWLLSQGQWNSSKIYPAVYGLLLKDRNAGLTQMYCYSSDESHLYFIKELPAKEGDVVYNSNSKAVGTVLSLGLLDDSIQVSPYEVHEGIDPLAGELPRDAKNDKKLYFSNVFSVKLNTEKYDDFDFVLNMASETFRLPIKSKIAGGRGVVGNGIGLGLTSLKGNYGLTYTSGAAYNKDAYGMPTGSSVKAQSNDPKGVVGVTTDSTKSGLETTDDGLYLYFYVGETVQNVNLINAGRIEESLAQKVNNNLDNTAPKLDNTFIEKLMPDYSASINIPLPVTEANKYIAKTACIYAISAHTSVSGKLYINGLVYAQIFKQDGYVQDNSIFVFLNKNDYIYWDKAIDRISSQYIIPLKGAN